MTKIAMCLVGGAALVGWLAISVAGSQMPMPKEGDMSEMAETGIYLPGGIKWKQGPSSLPAGAEFAVLEGDPSKAGPFVFRVKVPDGFTIPPHTHPKAERVTVIAGTFNLGMGDKIDKSMGQAIPVGSFGYWPAGMKHFAWAKGETIVQFHGNGPWVINYLNPADDPRNAKQP
ncbi:MAG: cupin domain-containing protein [Planctomycetota bacterium]